MKKFFVLIFCIIIFIIIIFTKKNDNNVLDITSNSYLSVNNFFIYGNHLNLEGNIKLENFNSINLVLKNKKEEISFDVNYDNGKIYTSDLINEGILLDDISIGKYYLLLKVVDDKVTYYSLKNNSSYNDINYYTITKNNSNNLINIKFDSLNNKDFMFFNVSNNHDEYYDVVVDAGHGGEDSGASYAKHDEAIITLKYALALKEKLETLGLKVKLTRDDDIMLNSYGLGSRTGIVYESKAKYVFSIHLNSSEEKIYKGGVEIYAPNNANLDFADSLASNIVKSANTYYSSNESFKIKNGVYVRTFTKNDINEALTKAKNNGYKPYPITTNTTYYYMIREVGGIATNAYVDGRSGSKNIYYKSNVGAEGYLLELGYINYWEDLNNILDNKDLYIDGIVNAIKKEIY